MKKTGLALKFAIAVVAAGMLTLLAGPSGAQPSEPVKLSEFVPWLVHNSGPAKAKGIVYFINGWSGGLGLDEFHLAPYIMKTLSDNGWDGIVAKYPYGRVVPSARYTSVPGSAAFVEQRVRDFKAQGYKLVVVAGQSFGSWVAMAADQQKGFRADALWLMAPNIYGPKTLETGGKNPLFHLNYTDFVKLVPALYTPSVLSTFADDPYEPGGRAQLVSAHFERDNVPSLIIDRPAAFFGHFAGWLPVYDYLYGGCIGSFFEQPAGTPCVAPPFSDDDFRSVFNISRVAEADQKRVTSGDTLAGRSFVIYNLKLPDKKYHYFYQYKSATERDIMSPVAQSHETVSYRDGQQCVGSVCSVLLSWSDSQFLEFDPKSGSLIAWWIENKG
jgi:hypothetical protein